MYMQVVIFRNVKSGYESKLELAISREAAQAYVDRQNGSAACAMRERLNIGEMVYRLA
jgi:hypothetical protein